MFWFKKKAEVKCSLDYFDELKKQIELLSERVVVLELRSQLKPTGVVKVLEPVQLTRKFKKERKARTVLSAEDRKEICWQVKNGTKRAVLAAKYHVHVTTIGTIVKEGMNGQA